MLLMNSKYLFMICVVFSSVEIIKEIPIKIIVNDLAGT